MDPSTPAGQMIGYARVSTRDQNPESQERMLRDAGCARVFVDHGESSRVEDRPQWVACLDYMRPGDILTVRAIDRLAGTERMAIEIIHDLDRRGFNLKSLTEPDFDTTTPMGRAMFGMVAVFAQLRVDLIRSNTLTGLANARAKGRVGGRPPVMTPEKLAIARQMDAEGRPRSVIARTLGVSRPTLYRHLDATGAG